MRPGISWRRFWSIQVSGEPVAQLPGPVLSDCGLGAQRARTELCGALSAAIGQEHAAGSAGKLFFTAFGRRRRRDGQVFALSAPKPERDAPSGAGLGGQLPETQALEAPGRQPLPAGKRELTFLSAAPGSNVVGATASTLLQLDEAQDIEIAKYDKQIAPMAASTNATRVFWGTAWAARPYWRGNCGRPNALRKRMDCSAFSGLMPSGCAGRCRLTGALWTSRSRAWGATTRWCAPVLQRGAGPGRRFV